MIAALWLEWRKDNKIHTKAVNEHSHVTIGRESSCDILLADPAISHRHAYIFFDDSTFLLRNISETDPILFNQRWSIKPDQVVAIQPGDSLTFGSLKITISASQSPSSHRRSRVLFKVRCPGCNRVLDHELNDCPWCEASLVGAEALIFHAEEREQTRKHSYEEVEDSTSE